MSTLTSSAISTGKKFAPKAIGRRRPAEPPATTQSPSSTPAPASTASAAEEPVVERTATEEPAVDLTATEEPAQPINEDGDAPAAEPAPAAELPPENNPSSEAEPIAAHIDDAPIQQQSPPPTQIAHEPESVLEAPQRTSSPAPQQPPQEETVPPADGAAVDSRSRSASLSSLPSSPRLASPAPVNKAKRKLVEKPGSETAGPAKKKAKPAAPPKKAKKSSTRSNATAQAEGDAADVPTPSIEQTEPRAAPKPRKSRKKIVRRSNEETQNAEVDAESIAKPRGKAKRQTRRKKPVSAATVEENTPEPAATVSATASPENDEDGEETAPKPKRRRRRSADPSSDEDPELHEIDPNTVSMSDLTRDRGLGKTSEREKEMALIDWAEVARNRREDYERNLKAAQEEAEAKGRGEAPSSDAPAPADGVEPSAEEAIAAATEVQPTTDGVRLRIDEATGEIMVDEATLTIDRHAAAQAAAADQIIEEQVDLKSKINRMTWMNERKRDKVDRIPVQYSKSDPWSEEETERFYDALKMFGTDFMIISKMFPPKTRRHIKLKFNREERADPERINAALLGKDAVRYDIDHFAQEVGRDVSVFHKYDSMEDAIQKLGEETAVERADLERQAQEATENQRRKTKRQVEQDQARAKREADRASKRAAKKSKRAKNHGFGTLGGIPEGGDDADAATAA